MCYFAAHRRRSSAFSFCLAKKKTLAKEKAPGGISNFPPDPLKATRKTTLVFLDLSCTRFRPGKTNDVHCTRKPNGTARRPSPTRRRGFSRRIPNIFVGDGLCAVPLLRTQANPYNLTNFIGSRFTRPIQTQLLSILVPIVERRVVRRCKASP